MKENNICPKCGETSEPDWDTCWNCQTKLSPSIAKEVEGKKSNESNNNSLVMVDGKRIASAGKQLKLSVIIFIISLVLTLAGYIAVSITDNNGIYGWVIGINIILLVGILINIFQAGRDLIKSVPKKEK